MRQKISDKFYHLPPLLRLFVQPKKLLCARVDFISFGRKKSNKSLVAFLLSQLDVGHIDAGFGVKKIPKNQGNQVKKKTTRKLKNSPCITTENQPKNREDSSSSRPDPGAD